MKNRCREQKNALRTLLELKHLCDQSQDERLLQWGEVLGFVFIEFMGARTTHAVELAKSLIDENPIGSDADRTQLVDLVDSAMNALDNVDTSIAAATDDALAVRDPETGEFVDLGDAPAAAAGTTEE